MLLLDQDRSRWNHAAVERGLDALHRAEMLATSPGRYALQAAIAASHARASRAQDTDWQHIAGLFATLAAVLPSPIVELNRAVALGMAYGAQAGLALVDQLTDLAALRNYHLLPSIRGDFLYKLGRLAEAQSEFERAAELTLNVREKEISLARAAACVPE